MDGGVCGLVIQSLWGPKVLQSPNKDSKRRKCLSHGDISCFPLRTKAILNLGVRIMGFGYRLRLGLCCRSGLGSELGVRENMILNGNTF